MAKKKSTSTRRTASSVKVRTRNKKKGDGISSRVVIPMAVSGVLLLALALVVGFGYRTATASEFFKLKAVDIRGNDRTSTEEIRKVVTSAAAQTGVWNADLGDIRTRIEKFPFVRSASVSMQLPAGIRVNVVERIPAAIVQLSSGTFLVDGDGTILAAATDKDKQQFAFAMQGWDESKTEKAVGDNVARLKVYRKMADEWQQFSLAERVKLVNLANPRQPVAIVEDSGHPITVSLARDSLGKSLKTALEALAGKGAKIKAVDVEGASPVIQYLGEH